MCQTFAERYLPGEHICESHENSIRTKRYSLSVHFYYLNNNGQILQIVFDGRKVFVSSMLKENNWKSV